MNANFKTIKIKHISLVTILFQLFGFFAQAQKSGHAIQELSVPISAGTRSYIAQQLVKKFSVDQPFTTGEIQTLLNDFSALYELKGTQVRSLLYQSIFQDTKFDGKILTTWILQKFDTIAPTRGGNCGSISEAKFIACYTPFENKIRLSPLFFSDKRINRLSTLIHEARHSQGYHHLSADNASEDGIINGARGAEWSFLAAIATNCTNCLLMDKISAYKYSSDISAKIKSLSFNEQRVFDKEIRALRDPLEEKYLPLITKLKTERPIVHAMPSVCLNNIPFSEFTGVAEQFPTVDCILLYYFVNSQEAKQRPELLKRSLALREGFLLILNPVEKKQ